MGLLGVCTDADTQVHELSGPEQPVLGRLKVSQTMTEASGAQNRYREVRWCGKVGQKTQNPQVSEPRPRTPCICVTLYTECLLPIRCGHSGKPNPPDSHPHGAQTGRRQIKLLTSNRRGEHLREDSRFYRGPGSVSGRNGSAAAVSCLGDEGLQREAKGEAVSWTDRCRRPKALSPKITTILTSSPASPWIHF